MSLFILIARSGPPAAADLSSTFIPVATTLLAGGLGVIGGWIAARNVNQQGARRLAYGKYIGALDAFLRPLRFRIQLAAKRVEPEKMPDMPSGRDVGAAFGEIIIIAPKQMVELVDRLQKAVIDLEVWSFKAPNQVDPTGAPYEKLNTDLRELRKEFIEAARRDAGTKELGEQFWRRGSEQGNS